LIHRISASPDLAGHERAVVSFPAALTSEEIDKINSLLGERQWRAVEQGGAETEDYRIARLQWLMAEDADWLYQRLAGFVREANGRYFGFDLDGFHDPLQATLYDAAERGHYDWHIDRGTHVNHNPPRKLTVLVQLSDPESYTGGELQILVDRSPQSLDRRAGSLHVLPSFVLHRVTPVENGSRIAIVGWITGPKFR
jgi:PKHD-type hydroxylase